MARRWRGGVPAGIGMSALAALHGQGVSEAEIPLKGMSIVHTLHHPALLTQHRPLALQSSNDREIVTLWQGYQLTRHGQHD